MQEASLHILHQKISVENCGLLWLVLLGIKSLVLLYCYKKVLILHFHEILQKSAPKKEVLTRQLKLLKIYLHVDQRCQQKCKSKNLCSKSMGNHFLYIWRILWSFFNHDTLLPKITCQLFSYRAPLLIMLS